MRMRISIILVALVAIMALAGTANAALYPIIGHANINSTPALQAAMRDRPDVAAAMARQARVSNKISNWQYCGDVTSSERAELIRRGYKNTAYDSSGSEETLGSLKDGPLAWACYVNLDKVKKDLQRRLGRGVRVRCTTKPGRKGAIVVSCKGRKTTYRVTAPTRVTRIPVGKDCFNRQHAGEQTTPETVVTGLWTVWKTVKVKEGKRIICPDGSWARATAGARGRGFGFGTTRQAAMKMAKRNASASVSVQVGCGPAKRLPPPPPLTCEQRGDCPREIRASAQCDFMVVENSLTSNLTVDAVVFYTADNATLTNVKFDWGDGTVPDNTTAVKASHTYARASTYIVDATLAFTKSDGTRITSNCAGITITPKDSTGSPVIPNPGTPGDPGPSRGTGESCRLPDGSVGYKDQFGNCNAY